MATGFTPTAFAYLVFGWLLYGERGEEHPDCFHVFFQIVPLYPHRLQYGGVPWHSGHLTSPVSLTPCYDCLVVRQGLEP